MNIITNYITLVLCFMLCSCATTSINYAPMVSDTAKLIYNDGTESLHSEKLNVVVIGVNKDFETKRNRTAFTLAIKNNSEDPFNISYENIEVFHSSNGELINLSLISYEQLVKEENSKAAWAALAVGLSAAANSYNASMAGYSNTYGSNSGNIYSNYGDSYNYSGYSYTSTYDSGKAYAAQSIANAENQKLANEVSQNYKNKLQLLKNNILKNHTLFPNSWHGGVIQVENPLEFTNGDSIIFDLSTGKESHRLNFTISKN